MYRLPVNTRLVKIDNLYSITNYASMVTPSPNVVWVPSEYAGAHYGPVLDSFQRWAIENRVTVYYPRNLLYCIMAHCPIGEVPPEYPIGLPTKFNQKNRETSIMYFSIDNGELA